MIFQSSKNMKMSSTLKASLVCLLFTVFQYCSSNDDKNNCQSKETCSDCIRIPSCNWCMYPDGKCGDEFSITAWCPKKHITGRNEEPQVISNKELKAGSDPVQIKPQHLKLKLRVGEEKRILISYQQALDYPIDLYYLMDLSKSMEDDKDKLSKLGDKLTDEMKTITNNFRVGFGSFVDKPEAPFIDTAPEKLKSPCINCIPAYSFKNTLPLTNNTQLFSKKIKEAPMSGNLDHPEGGFDALMQAMVCTEEIGWRDKARHLLIMSTDSIYHLAGDGKLGGIVEPNDEVCHLDEKGSYTHSLLQDYPSIAQLNKIADKNNVNIIFAITRDCFKYYDQLKNSIQGAAVGVLEQHSSNVISMIKTEYEKLVHSFKISDDAKNFIKIEYFTKCTGEGKIQTNECTGLKGRPLLEFTAAITVLDCPDDENQWKQTIHIKPGTLNEILKIELDIQCQCSCEMEGAFEKNSQNCSSQGSLKCGVCWCNEERYGRFCECSSQEGDTRNIISDCKPNNETKEICSNLGTCKCGKCDCNKRANPQEIISGKYCECNNFNCKLYEGVLCSGPERGFCACGKCVCTSGWSGEACECRDTNTTCIAPGSSDVCSGNGTCVCGVCQCNSENNFHYSGQYCEECPHCTTNKCNEFRHCVECQVHNTGKYNHVDCNMKCTAFQTIIVDQIEDYENEEGNSERICRVPDDLGCTIVFKYKYENDKTFKVMGQKFKECVEPVDLFGVISIAVGTTVLAGIILLIIWKVLTTIHDRNEYIKFEKEIQSANFDGSENPLYRSIVSTFQNPSYRG